MDEAHHLSRLCDYHWDSINDSLGSGKWHNSIHLFVALESCYAYHYLLDCSYTTSGYHATGDHLQAFDRCGSSLPQSDPCKSSPRWKRICSKCIMRTFNVTNGTVHASCYVIATIPFLYPLNYNEFFVVCSFYMSFALLFISHFFRSYN